MLNDGFRNSLFADAQSIVLPGTRLHYLVRSSRPRLFGKGETADVLVLADMQSREINFPQLSSALFAELAQRFAADSCRFLAIRATWLFLSESGGIYLQEALDVPENRKTPGMANVFATIDSQSGTVCLAPGAPENSSLSERLADLDRSVLTMDRDMWYREVGKTAGIIADIAGRKLPSLLFVQPLPVDGKRSGSAYRSGSSLFSVIFAALVILAAGKNPLYSESAEIDPSGGYVLPPAGPVEYEPLRFADMPGSWAMYRDETGSEPAYLGLFYVGGNELAIRYYRPSDKKELLVLQTWHVGSGGSSAGPEASTGALEVIRGDLSDAAALQSVSNAERWAQKWLQARTRMPGEPEVRLENEAGSPVFQFWIPLFAVKEFDSARVRLVSAGLSSSGADPAFFDWKGEPAEAKGPGGKIVPGTPGSVFLEGLELPLDSAWTDAASAPEEWAVPAKVLALNGREAARVLVDTVDLSAHASLDLPRLMSAYLLQTGGYLSAEGLSVSVVDGVPCLFCRVLDPETGLARIQFRLFFSRGGSVVSVLGLEADESVYLENEAYFESILF